MDEGSDFAHGLFRVLRKVLGNWAQVGARREQAAQGAADGIALVRRKTKPHQAHLVDSAPAHGVGAGDDGEGGDIARDHAAAGDHAQAADPGVLVERAIATKDGAFADHAMATQRGTIDQDHAVANLAVMADVTAGHQAHAIAEDGGLVFAGGAVDRGVLVELAISADAHQRALSLIFVVLRFAAEHHATAQNAARAQLSAAQEVDMGAEPAAVAHHYAGFEHAVRADFDARAQFNSGIHHGSGVNHGFHEWRNHDLV